jgi:hypothetical protein
MRTLTLRKAALVAALPVALSSLAACGDSSSQAVATDPQGVASSGPADGSTPAAAATVGKADFLAMLKSAAQKITTARFAMTMDMSGQTVPVKGVIDMTGDSPAMQMTMDMTGSGAPADMRLVDKTIYFQMPGAGGKFYKIDLADPNGPMGSLGGDTFDNIDPGQLTANMSPRAFRKITDHGVSSVKGQQLHHYTAQIDLSAARKIPNLPSTAALPKSATYDVWLDDQGRFARFRMFMKNTMRMTATYSDYGSAAHVVAPPASDVVAMPGTSTNG